MKKQIFFRYVLPAFAILLIPVWTPIALRILGFYVNEPGWKIAKIAAERNDVSICSNIIIMPWLEAFSHSTEEQQDLCIYDYASITNDPSVCERLLPSNYGWSCLGAAQKTADACSIDYGKTVAWPLGDPTSDQWGTASMAECTVGNVQGEPGRKCCYILELTSDPDINDCSQFENDIPFMNFCLSQLAMKTKDESICINITDENKRLICEIQARNL